MSMLTVIKLFGSPYDEPVIKWKKKKTHCFVVNPCAFPFWHHIIVIIFLFCARYNTAVISSDQCSRCRSHWWLWIAVSACLAASCLLAEHTAVTPASSDAAAWTQSSLLCLGFPFWITGWTTELAAEHAERCTDMGRDAAVWCWLVAT